MPAPSARRPSGTQRPLLAGDLAALHDELVALLGVEVSILTSGSRIGRDPQVLADATAL